jgi:SAM-dependent methyltransferase
MNLLESIHDRCIHTRRARVLADHFSPLIPQGCRVLDVGCGDGLLADAIARKRPDITVQGIDVQVRPQTLIPVESFDGRRIPYADGSFEIVSFMDVLHHTEDPLVLLREAGRVAAQAVLIKDHTLEGSLASFRLRLMDWVGNARHGVELPYNYWPRRRWLKAFESLGWSVDVWHGKLGLYVWPASLCFDASLHFIARLRVP